MAELHFFGGEKGGVGKSFICRAAIQFLLAVSDDERPKPFVVFETDRSNDDVRRIYGKVAPVKLAIFSESEKFEDAANAIYNCALFQRVLVNLPAQVFPAIRQWWEVNQIAKLAPADGISIHLWFVTDGGFDSLSLFKDSVKFFGGSVRHILAKNHGKADEFDALGDDEALQALIEDYQIPVVNFPKCQGSRARTLMDRESLTFEEAIECAPPVLDRLNRARVARFLEGAYDAFQAGGLFS